MHHAYIVNAFALSIDWRLHIYIRTTYHILFPCLLFQIEFPTLLAKREIIANAFVFTHNVLGTILILERYPMQRYNKKMKKQLVLIKKLFLSAENCKTKERLRRSRKKVFSRKKSQCIILRLKYRIISLIFNTLAK